MPAILVTDDDQAIRELLVESLALHTDWVATGVEDGATLQAALDAAKPDLIMLDVIMPGLDGIEVYRRLRAREELAEVPVLFVTVDDRQVRHANLAGPHDVVAKPFSLRDLLARAEALLGA